MSSSGSLRRRGHRLRQCRPGSGHFGPSGGRRAGGVPGKGPGNGIRRQCPLFPYRTPICPNRRRGSAPIHSPDRGRPLPLHAYFRLYPRALSGRPSAGHSGAHRSIPGRKYLVDNSNAAVHWMREIGIQWENDKTVKVDGKLYFEPGIYIHPIGGGLGLLEQLRAIALKRGVNPLRIARACRPWQRPRRAGRDRVGRGRRI